MSRPAQSFYYLASPYTDYPGGHEAAVAAVLKVAASLTQAGWHIYSPIIHTHQLAQVLEAPSNGKLDQYRYWLGLDLPFLTAAVGIILPDMLGVWASRGIRWEVEWCERRGKLALHAYQPTPGIWVPGPAIITPDHWCGKAAADPLPADLLDEVQPVGLSPLHLAA